MAIPEPSAGGRWALARIVTVASTLGSGVSFTTAASVERIATTRTHYFPPLRDDHTGYVNAWALVHLVGPIGAVSGDVLLLPALTLDQTLNALTNPERNQLRTALESRCLGYSYTDNRGQAKTIAALSGSAWSSSTLYRDVLKGILGYSEHSDRREPRVSDAETHNTEFLDSFATDPSGRWTAQIESATWDSGNSEYDVDLTGQAVLLEYTANTPGSIEHEAQVTTIAHATEPRIVGAAVRIDGSLDDYYAVGGDRATDMLQLWRRQSGSVAEIFSSAVNFTGGNFSTFRLAAAGAAGANVALAIWHTDHGVSKPSDPGWNGANASPDLTFTDTGANRLDDSTHDGCGIGSDAATTQDYDTRHCFWKSRAISDRSTGSTITPGAGSAALAGRALSLGRYSTGGLVIRKA
jgi:hypothetical protein